MTENETKAVKFIENIKSHATVTLDHIAKEEPNVSPLVYKGREEKANTILVMVEELKSTAQSAHRKNAGRLWRSRRQGDRITKETDTPTDILCMIHGFALAAESTTRLIMIITITARIAVRN